MKHTQGHGANPTRPHRAAAKRRDINDPPLEAMAHHPKESLRVPSARAARVQLVPMESLTGPEFDMKHNTRKYAATIWRYIKPSFPWGAFRNTGLDETKTLLRDRGFHSYYRICPSTFYIEHWLTDLSLYLTPNDAASARDPLARWG